jgi:hypothetical protein
VLGVVLFKVRPEEEKYLSIDGKKVEVEIANTPVLREQGLSERKSLCSGCSMLFLFPEPGIHSFWMRKMYFDIDIIWVNGESIVDISQSVPKPGPEDFESPRQTYTNKTPADKVIEVNSGWCEANGIEIGDKISFDKQTSFLFEF